MFKLYNGDCLNVLDDLISKGVKVDTVITDPPYGTTECKWDIIIPFDEMWDRINRITHDTSPIILFGSEPFSSLLRLSNIKNYRYDWKWNKVQGTGFSSANKQPLRVVEDIMVFYRKLGIYSPIMEKETG